MDRTSRENANNEKILLTDSAVTRTDSDALTTDSVNCKMDTSSCHGDRDGVTNGDTLLSPDQQQHVAEVTSEQQKETMTSCQKGAVLFSSTLCFFFLTFQVVAFGAYYVVLTQHFNVSKLTAGWVGSIHNAMSHAGSILVAPLIRRVGSRRLVQASGVIVLVGYVSSAFSPNIFTLYFTHGIVSGFGTAIFHLCAIVEIQQTFTATKVATAQTIASLGLSSGSILAGLVMPWLLGNFGWRGTLLLEGAVLLHTIPLASAYRRHHHPPLPLPSDGASSSSSTPATPTSDTKKRTSRARGALGQVLREALDFSIFRNSTFVMFCVARMCIWFSFQTILSHTPSRAVDLGLTLQQGTLLVSFISIGTFLCRPLLIALTHSVAISTVLLAAVGAAASTVLLATIAFTSQYYALIAQHIALGMTIGTIITLFAPMVLELFGSEHVARNQAVSLLVDGCCQLVAPPLAGAFVDLTGSYAILYVILSVLTAVCAAVFVVLIVVTRSAEKRSAEIDS